MAEVEFEAVLEFLRKNGLSECESALMEDIMEKSQLGSSEFEKFFFPMAPPPPPLRIPSASRLPLPPEVSGGGDSSRVRLMTKFTNPYGIRTSRPTSQASSDTRLSQFGTARDYPDFDMQNDLFWYKEKDEDFAMPHLFGDGDFYGDSSEDKYVTTVQTGEHIEDLVAYNFISDGSIKYVESRSEWENLKDKAYKDYYELGELFRLDQSDKSTKNFARDSTCDWVGGFDNTDEFHTIKKDDQQNENDSYEFIYDDVFAGENHEPEAAANEESGAISDELLIYDTKEDDYEIFNLRIIHRKNRTGFEENKEFPIVINKHHSGSILCYGISRIRAFSKVVQAHDLYSGMDVCLKIIKNDKDFFDQSLDEIKLLKFVNKHDPADEQHILRLYDYFYFQVITRQCLEALSYLHDLGIMHCDLKPENILIKSYRKCQIKVIDLGSSCFQTDNLSLYVQSRSYRAPEVMLGLPYDQKIDLWSLGCILAELCSGEVCISSIYILVIRQVLFPNEAVVMLLARMIAMLGPIDMEMMQKGQETHKYFTKEYDLYCINEDTNKMEYIVPEETSLEHHLQISILVSSTS
ncbi:hypothetical protein DH2020_044371 [Rehmannia glutinosa]|uniref:Protein kinase domain-containing protein n=1 Tax=Rehmannia glutinosa TaxID=99300 RepID=A0ABR0UHV7_REHGL